MSDSTRALPSSLAPRAASRVARRHGLNAQGLDDFNASQTVSPATEQPWSTCNSNQPWQVTKPILLVIFSIIASRLSKWMNFDRWILSSSVQLLRTTFCQSIYNVPRKNTKVSRDSHEKTQSLCSSGEPRMTTLSASVSCSNIPSCWLTCVHPATQQVLLYFSNSQSQSSHSAHSLLWNFWGRLPF